MDSPSVTGPRDRYHLLSGFLLAARLGGGGGNGTGGPQQASCSDRWVRPGLGWAVPNNSATRW